MQRLVDRFVGCMVGAVIGDALGSEFEHVYLEKPVPLNVVLEYFASLEREDEKRHFTDDTEMTKALAESLIGSNGYDPVDCAKRYVEEFYAEKDYNPAYGVHASLIFPKWRDASTSFDYLDPARHQFSGKGSCGNGSAMRVAPVALFCYGNLDLAIKMSKETSLLTHTHPDGINGCLLQCLAVTEALRLKQTSKVNSTKFVNTLLKDMRIAEALSYKSARPYCDKLERMKELLLRRPVPTEQEVIDDLGNGILANDSVPIAIFAFLQGINRKLPGIETDNEFEKIIQYAISLGGDTDTIASMAGAIAGAFLGYSDTIPARLQDACRGIEDAKSRAHKLVDVVLSRKGPPKAKCCMFF